jgi:transcriptional regulator with XRE-family HTH domain
MLDLYMATRRSHMTLRTSAAQIIREHRSEAGVSQVELAKRLNVSQPLVSAWECGKVIPCIDDLVAIELALKVVKGRILMKVAYPD